MCGSFPMGCVLRKISVVNSKEYQGIFLEERWYIQAIELSCVFHNSIGNRCFQEQGPAIRYTVVLCVEEVYQLLVPGVMVNTKGQP